MLTAYPESVTELIDEEVEWEMQAVIDLISRVRNIRSEMNIKPGERIPLLIGSPDEKLRKVYSASVDQISKLARALTFHQRTCCTASLSRAVLLVGRRWHSLGSY